MQLFKNLKFYVITFFSFLLVPKLVLSAGEDPPPDVSSIEDIVNILEFILEKAYQIFFIAAAGSILYSAYMFLFATESDEQITKARRGLYYTVSAIVVALLAYVLDNLVADIISSGVNN
ncbi:MAG: hypothetical protein ABEI53_01970 [Candidatus Magasanikbacteria bacterium]